MNYRKNTASPQKLSVLQPVRRVFPEAEHFEEPPQVEEEWDRERPEEEFPAADRIRPPEAEPSEPDSNIFPEDFTEDAWTSRAPEREEPGELEPEPEQSFVHEGGPAVTPPPELEEKELSDLEPPPSATREEQEKETKKPSPGGLKNLPGIGKASDLFGKAKEGFATFQEYKGQYGPVIKKTLRALILFGFESIRQFKFKVLQLAWTTGGDPASLGQILGFHEALVASVDPRLRRHVYFVPQWENDDLSPRGSGHIELYIWPYRFVPPFFRFFFRLPWIGIFRIAREQMRKNKS